MTRNLFLVRHGSVGADGRYVGSTDLPLVPEGRKQIEKISLLLKEKAITQVFCSPMTRCIQTMELLGLDSKSTVLNELREIDFGDFENLQFSDIEKQWPEQVKLWAQAPDKFRFPGGESTPAFRDRILDAQGKIDSCKEENVLVIAHGGIIRHLICCYLNINLDNYLLFNILPGTITWLKVMSQGGILHGLNQGYV